MQKKNFFIKKRNKNDMKLFKDPYSILISNYLINYSPETFLEMLFFCLNIPIEEINLLISNKNINKEGIILNFKDINIFEFFLNSHGILIKNQKIWIIRLPGLIKCLKEPLIKTIKKNYQNLILDLSNLEQKGFLNLPYTIDFNSIEFLDYFFLILFKEFKKKFFNNLFLNNNNIKNINNLDKYLIFFDNLKILQLEFNSIIEKPKLFKCSNIKIICFPQNQFRK